MPKTRSNASLFQYVLMAAVALFRWGAQRLWSLLTFWKEERKKPVPDRQKIDRQKAFAGLLAIALAVGGVAFFVWKGLIAVFSMGAAFIDRQYVLYIGLGLLFVGTTLLRMQSRLPPEKRRVKLALALSALGALCIAYGMGYF